MSLRHPGTALLFRLIVLRAALLAALLLLVLGFIILGLVLVLGSVLSVHASILLKKLYGTAARMSRFSGFIPGLGEQCG